MKLSFDVPATFLLYVSMPNFFSFVGIALAIINQLYNISRGMKREGGFKKYFSSILTTFKRNG